MRLLNDPEWSHWSDREIARACKVGAPLVGKFRPDQPVTVTNYSEPASRTYTTKHGTVATMNTAAIGQRPAPAPPPYDAPAQRPEVQVFAREMEANSESASGGRRSFQLGQ